MGSLPDLGCILFGLENIKSVQHEIVVLIPALDFHARRGVCLETTLAQH